MKAYLELDEPRILQELQPVWLIRFEVRVTFSGYGRCQRSGSPGAGTPTHAQKIALESIPWLHSILREHSFSQEMSITLNVTTDLFPLA